MIERRATYRLQLNSKFTFDQAADAASYLAALGVSHAYFSPYLQAVPGSNHGYDVADPKRLNEELGGAAAFDRLCGALHKHSLAQVLDIVPNHMAIVDDYNPWWVDVLENGPSSNYASYFDVDWDPPEARLRNSILIPVLGDQYGRVLESGDIRLEFDDGVFYIRYYEHRFPVAPRSLDSILSAAASRCGLDEMGFLADSYTRLPAPTVTDLNSIRLRHRDKAVLFTHLKRLVAQNSQAAAAINEVITAINQLPDALHNLLERQNYRLAYWRAASRDLGYRRFFDINSLVGLRMEDKNVFAETHSLILQWLKSGVLDGVRVDHIDGLRDPEQYLGWLQEASPSRWLLVEKILTPGECLPESWPIAGTTGYDFLNLVGGLFVDPRGEQPLSLFYAEFTGSDGDYAALIRQKKVLIMREVLGSDLNRLTAMLVEICETHPRYRDHTRHELYQALIAVAAHFPVYRTYVRVGGQNTLSDERYISEALEAAKQDRPEIDPRLLDFIGALLLLEKRGQLESEFALRFQQFTGPVMAKAVEDTAFYCFNRLTSLNEVGGDPLRFGVGIDDFYRACKHNQARWPHCLLATSTHDCKRGEDVRARINLLSEIPHQWIEAVRRWSSVNQPCWRNFAPDRNAEYLFYQTLLGAWPLEKDRLLQFMQKAAREAKVHTSWTDQNTQYEEALAAFVEGALENKDFMADFSTFAAPLVLAGQLNSLSQTLIKLTAPGVPDIYQGSELWNLSLVDPDNRQPVDYDLRRRLLKELGHLNPEQIMQRIDCGMPKLYLTYRALTLRRHRPALFGSDGSFVPIPIRGAHADHVIAYCRGQSAITVAPRLMMQLGDNWENTSIELPRGRWHNELTGEMIEGGGAGRIASLLRRFPVSLLSRQD